MHNQADDMNDADGVRDVIGEVRVGVMMLRDGFDDGPVLETPARGAAARYGKRAWMAGTGGDTLRRSRDR